MLTFDSQLKRKIPDLKIATTMLTVERVEGKNPELEALRKTVINGVRSRYSLETVKDVKIFRCYRDFFWKLGIDPTKVRPASEALIRRILQTGSIPTINTAVDAINIASIQTEVVVDAFDAQKLTGKAEIRFASKGERFLGIGMKNESILQGREIIVSDGDGPIAIYPHRDGERTKITQVTRDILTISCGVPGIDYEKLFDAAKEVSKTVIQFCGGKETSKSMLLPL